MRKIKYLVIHHSAGPASVNSDGAGLYKLATDVNHLKSVGIFVPPNTKKWSEYHYIVARNGTIIYCMDKDNRNRVENDKWILGHCGNDNEKINSVTNANSIGICFEGNFHTYGEFTAQQLTAEQLKAGMRLLLELCRQYKLDSSVIVGHKDIIATACPGKWFPLNTIKANIQIALSGRIMSFALFEKKNMAQISYENDPYGMYAKTLPLPPFISGGKGWVPAGSVYALGFNPAIIKQNINKNILITDLAIKYGFDVNWIASKRCWYMKRSK